MVFIEHSGEVEITKVSDFDLVKILECGQCFRWNAEDNGVYSGVARGYAAKLRQEGDSVFISGTMNDFKTCWRDYFDFDRDYAQIRRKLSVDDFMNTATAYGAGIRILRQDKWEALCSFIISQCNNIPRIKAIISRLCRYFGNVIEINGTPGFDCKSELNTSSDLFYTFPSAERLAELDVSDLDPIRCGYRADYIVNAAKAVATGALDLDSLSRIPPDAARKELKKLRGVGDKVADCVMLFGLNMLDAFPLDVWMKRAVSKHYGPAFDPIVFSPYAGVAQQYIFYYTRNGSGGAKDGALSYS